MRRIDNLPTTARDALLEHAKPRDYPKGALVDGLSDDAGGIYIVTRGVARRSLGGARGEHMVLGFTKPGDLFGQTVSTDGAP